MFTVTWARLRDQSRTVGRVAHLIRLPIEIQGSSDCGDKIERGSWCEQEQGDRIARCGRCEEAERNHLKDKVQPVPNKSAA